MPTANSRTYAIDGFSRPESLTLSITPRDINVISIYTISVPIRPSTVALPTSLCFLALPETTTAPSIPINVHKVTNIVLFTCVTIPPKSLVPQNSNVNLSKLNKNIRITINKNIGTNLAIVVIRFISAAPLTPFNINNVNAQTNIDAPITDATLLPTPNTGKK